MTEYASVHPSSYGHVNRVNPGVVPAFCACNRVCVDMEGHWIEITTNDPNPIPLMIRMSVADRSTWDESEDADGPWEFRYQRWLQYVVNGDVDPEDGYPLSDEFAHAEKVLRRLIALDNQEAWV